MVLTSDVSRLHRTRLHKEQSLLLSSEGAWMGLGEHQQGPKFQFFHLNGRAQKVINIICKWRKYLPRSPPRPGGLLWDSNMKSPCSTKHKAWRMARFLTSNSEYDRPYTGTSMWGKQSVLFKGMVCVYLQEKRKARSEKDKKNMGTALETHFNTLFLNQIIKIWLASFGTEVIFKLCRF